MRRSNIALELSVLLISKVSSGKAVLTRKLRISWAKVLQAPTAYSLKCVDLPGALLMRALLACPITYSGIS